jgi:hypothetical protein
MTEPTPNRPLWREMYEAYDQSTAPSGLAQDWADHHGYAAEIRAIAQRLAAKQSGLLETGHTMSVDEAILWLGYEADRAEELHQAPWSYLASPMA